MTEIILTILAVLVLIQIGLAIFLLMRLQANRNVDTEAGFTQLTALLGKTDQTLRDEFSRSRAEAAQQSKEGRQEAAESVSTLGRNLREVLMDMAGLQKDNLAAFAKQLEGLTLTLSAGSESLRNSLNEGIQKLQSDAVIQAQRSHDLATQSLKGMADQASQSRAESSKSVQDLGKLITEQMASISTLQKDRLEAFALQIQRLSQSTEQRMDILRQAVDEKLNGIQADNAQKLEQIRATVDEKLHATLEQRLGESFKLVSERLELVHKGLGEMQSLASGVGDLKKVLTNIKTRGTWGEVQAQRLLEELLTPEQYACNIVTNPAGNDPVEFAVKLPGKSLDGAGVVYLPIDAKFPREDYDRLLDAQEKGDLVLVEEAGKALDQRIRKSAKDIHDKYIAPPYTTDFGIMFLPTEGLYAEVLRRPGMAECLQRDYRIILTGPTTLAALLNSLQMGFRTLVIEKRSSEVWQVLGAVKTEFGKFGDVMDKVQKKLQEASNQIDTVSIRSRAIQRKLKGVQELPSEQAQNLLGAGIEEETDEEKA